jgi:hypothetical protein
MSIIIQRFDRPVYGTAMDNLNIARQRAKEKIKDEICEEEIIYTEEEIRKIRGGTFGHF